ncbi:MAG: hypothetical protein ROO76_20245 [Terriglobia bacterium]|jgi:hypothetical protein|nr:hypothetical protein [Terriglobia bacterium]
MRALTISFLVLFSFAAFCYSQNPPASVVCVSAVTDTTGKSIGSLGNLNDQLAQDISDRKPLKGVSIPADITGHAQPGPECDYVLEITLHVGGSTGIALNPPKPKPLDPGVDPRRTTSEWLVQASYRLMSTPKAIKSVRFEDDLKERYEPNVVGYGTDLGSVARRLAHTAASSAAGKLKKKLKL